MSETRYPLGDEVIRFGYDDYRYGCLCTFPYNYVEKKFGVGTVESFALLGASLCLYRNKPSSLIKNEYSDEYVIPDCLPEWIRNEIRRNCGDYPEKFDGCEYDIDYLPSSATDEDCKKLLIKRYTEIKEWAEQSIEDIENGEY